MARKLFFDEGCDDVLVNTTVLTRRTMTMTRMMIR